MQAKLGSVFSGIVSAPLAERTSKPRLTGITMVIDKGVGLTATHDLLQSSAAYMDLLKLGFGTALLYSDKWLREKIRLAKEYEVLIYPGGTLLELATFQNRGFAFIDRIAELGFTAVEISEGTIDLDRALRRQLIEHGVSCGLVVLSEVGKKDASQELDATEAADAVRRDLDSGSTWVIIEGRDSGRGVGVYDAHGGIKSAHAEEIMTRVGDVDRIIWEAPTTAQQNAWLMRLGPHANFGNVQPHDVISLEATRQGLRGDTLKSYVDGR